MRTLRLSRASSWPQLYRGVIREKDILACENGQVRFGFRNAKTGKLEQRTVPGADFLWLILQRVLPKGFRRARNFGFLHPNCKRLITLLQLLLKLDPARFTDSIKQRAPIPCACCGAVIAIVRTQIRASPWPRVTTPIPTEATRRSCDRSSRRGNRRSVSES